MEKATFAAGCFWKVEADFRKVPGVLTTSSGYSGGGVKNPSYPEVKAGQTGHAEAVELEYDPHIITYQELLDVFWNIHDPTTLNRQGEDVGSNYRSIIFYHTAEQEELARSSKARMDASGRFQDPIVTEIAPAGNFYRAEEYHQAYLERRGK